MTKKNFLSLVIGMAVFLCVLPQAFAQVPAAQMQTRIDALEKQVNELKLMLQEQQKARMEEKARVDKVEQKVDQTEKTKTASAGGAASTASAIISDFKFKPYGYIKVDASHDDNRASSGNFVLYVPSGDSAHQKHESFNMTIRETRIGLDILAPQKYSWTAKGKLEMDWMGDATQHDHKPEPLLRHAYLELTKGNVSIIAGQTWDIISPLIPSSNEYTVGWGIGNVGYRRPQVRFTYTQPINDRNKLIGAVGIFRTRGLTNEDLDGDSKNDGEDAGFPTVQARLAYATKLFCSEKDSTFGVSGHYGAQKIDWSLKKPGLHQKTTDTWSINADYEVPLTKRLSIKGEWFLGSNFDDYFGGAIQGVNTLDPALKEYTSTIKSIGGWTQLTYQINKWRYNVGAGIDDPRNSDLSTATSASKAMRSRNAWYYANFFYTLIPPVTLALEYDHFETEYKGWDKGKDNRIQTSIIYKW